jgi:hypothetical protein
MSIMRGLKARNVKAWGEAPGTDISSPKPGEGVPMMTTINSISIPLPISFTLGRNESSLLFPQKRRNIKLWENF